MSPTDNLIDCSISEFVRRPMQYEGIERGPERTANIAASGAVNPQLSLTWDQLWGQGQNPFIVY